MKLIDMISKSSDRMKCLMAALAATLIIRFTLYVEDCNLLVLAFTYLFLYIVFRLSFLAYNRLRGRLWKASRGDSADNP